MSLLFETIRLQNGELQNMEYHNFRMNESRLTLFGFSNTIHLQQFIHIPPGCAQAVYKCKVIYSMKVEEVILEPYEPRLVKSLKLVADNIIEYNYKHLDREHLNVLFAKRGNADEILIVKKGCITDTSFSNIIFLTGNRWVTPSIPLLQGTMRSFLLKNNMISEQVIKVSDLHLFQKARLINAMLPFESGIDIPIEKISF